MNLLLKEKIKQITGTGVSRIRFTQKGLDQMKEKKYNTKHSNELARKLVKEGFIRIIPKKIRRYKIIKTSKRKQKRLGKTVNNKDKYQPYEKLSYLLKRKIVNKKDIWMKKTRTLRALLKKNRKKMDRKTYSNERKKIKGNLYLSVHQFKKINEQFSE